MSRSYLKAFYLSARLTDSVSEHTQIRSLAFIVHDSSSEILEGTAGKKGSIGSGFVGSIVGN